MSPADRESLLTRLLGGDLNAPLGRIENDWLDVKSGIYPLDTARGADELAKDTAAFANSPSGGLLLVGYKTRQEREQEIVDSVAPVPRDLVDVTKHRNLIRSRIAPFIRDLGIHWVDAASDVDGTGVLIISVSPQESRPFVVRGAPASFIAMPVRDGDGTHWLSAEGLQSLLTLGWQANGGPQPHPGPESPDAQKTNRVLAALPRNDGWIQHLEALPHLKRIPGPLSLNLFKAENALERDRVDYLDAEVLAAHDDLLATLHQLSTHVQSTFPPLHNEGDYTEIPPDWQWTNREGYNDLRRNLEETRDAFLSSFYEMLNLLNRKGLLPAD